MRIVVPTDFQWVIVDPEQPGRNSHDSTHLTAQFEAISHNEHWANPKVTGIFWQFGHKYGINPQPEQSQV